MGVDFRPLWPRMWGSPSHGSKVLPTHRPMASTFHTYADLVTDAGRPARTDWDSSAADAVAATLRLDPDAIVSLAVDPTGCRLIGLMPGGLA